MAQLVRLVRQWPMLQCHCCSSSTLHHFLPSPSMPVAQKTRSHGPSLFTVLCARRDVHTRSRGLRLANAPTPVDVQEDVSSSGSDSYGRKSRNQLKREAQRAVRWGMELASFSTPQIKRILSVASLDKDVLDALVLVKRLGPDVREGKRRQFNYIGKLLRDVPPELMDVLIQAMKDGDHSKLQALSGSRTLVVEYDDEAEESEYEEEEQGPHIDMATRWLDGLINKDIDITNEVYSVQSVAFDRQELRKLVRRVQSAQERNAVAEENKAEVNAATVSARRSLTRFLCAVAKQMPSD